MGAIQERNKLIDDAIVAFKGCHDRYFPVGKSLPDDKWAEYIASMDAIADKYKSTNIAELSGALCMAFLNDTELVHKAWLKKEGKA